MKLTFFVRSSIHVYATDVWFMLAAVALALGDEEKWVGGRTRLAVSLPAWRLWVDLLLFIVILGVRSREDVEIDYVKGHGYCSL
jgi:hypothetical protein